MIAVHRTTHDTCEPDARIGVISRQQPHFRAERLPMADGMVPLSALSYSCKSTSCAQFVMLGGIVPVSWFTLKSRLLRDCDSRARHG